MILRTFFAFVSALLCTTSTVMAQPASKADVYPNKPVRMVVPFAPGGGTDVVGRIIAQRLTEVWPYPIVVDNRPGAGSTVGTALTARAVPDGYTIGAVSMSLAINTSLYRSLPYHPIKDFTHIGMLARAPNILVVHPSVPARSVKELVAFAKTKPGQLNYSSSGVGGTSHLSGEVFSNATGINIVHIPYKGAGPAMTALLSGEAQIMMATAPVALAQMKANRVRALGVSSRQRTALAPALPTIGEGGFPGVETDTWYGMIAPAGTPNAIVMRINSDIARVLKQPEVRALFEQQGAEPDTGTPQEFKAFIASEVIRWEKIIKAAKIEQQ
jgi:tripartite-type tricarboxylate transporter receptor subunit TctC